MKTLGLFEGFGVELEYMIVSEDSLDVLPVTDEVLKEIAGTYVSEVELGEIAWSNELVLHVIELKTNGPAPYLEGLVTKFQSDVNRINSILKRFGGRLMPGAMHPWMDPFIETRLWPHEYNPIYESYNRIFDCRGHGWSNLQSTHINLPFSNDDEFGKLHAAVRLLMPVMPALTASSPVMDGIVTDVHDNRLNVYRGNSIKVPSVSGDVIPEPVYSRGEYEGKLLRGIYEDISLYDPDGILQYEWLNSRGAIARFDRMAIEIRILDIQECPAADLATTALIVRVLKAMTEGNWVSHEKQKMWSVESLNRLFIGVTHEGGDYLIEDRDYLSMFGIKGGKVTATGLWEALNAQLPPSGDAEANAINIILSTGSLSKRIIRAAGKDPSRDKLHSVYEKLAECLDRGEMFMP